MFATTLPLIFSFTHLMTLWEFFSLLIILLLLAARFTPQINTSSTHQTYNGIYLYLHGVWLGRMALWQAFWPFFLLINAVLLYIDYKIAHNTYTINSWKTMHGMLLLPIIWWLIGVWRCAKHTGKRYWAISACTATLYLLLELLLRFILSTQYPHLLFDCRLLLIEYGDC